MSDTDEVVVRLMIVSESRTPQGLTDFIGLSCDKSWCAGETRPGTTIVEKNHGWIVESQMPRSATLSDQVARLLARLSPHRERIRRISDDEEVLFSCVVYSERRPPLVFRKEDVRGIADLGAALDVDIYILEPD